MANLSHWVYANDFTPYEAAFLILGIDPSTGTDGFSNRHILERIDEAYSGALSNLRHQLIVEPCLPDWMLDEEEKELRPPSKILHSVEMERLLEGLKQGNEVTIIAWVEAGRVALYEQRFSRSELGRWIKENSLPSAYPFVADTTGEASDQYEKEIPGLTVQPKTGSVTLEIDPADLPDELSAANIAFRAITNGYGNQSKPPRARLEDFLREMYPALKATAIDRIATIANPDKTTGRKVV